MTKTSEVVQPVLMAENEKDILIFQAGTVLWLEIGRQPEPRPGAGTGTRVDADATAAVAR